MEREGGGESESGEWAVCGIVFFFNFLQFSPKFCSDSRNRCPERPITAPAFFPPSLQERYRRLLANHQPRA